ncbi:unnamed protein product, partial [Mesorhabditis spiculigera]
MSSQPRFVEAELAALLEDLSPERDRIQNCRRWIMQRLRHISKIMDFLLNKIRSGGDPLAIMVLFYVINDVAQNANRLGGEEARTTLAAIQLIMAPACRHVASLNDETLDAKVRRTLDCNGKKKAAKMAEKKKAKQPSGTTAMPMPVKKSASEDNPFNYDAQQLNAMTKSLHNALEKQKRPPSMDLELREKISALPSYLANPGELNFIKTAEEKNRVLAEIAESAPLVNGYCQDLDREITNRRKTVDLLGEYLIMLRNVANRENEQIQWLKRKKGEVESDQKELELALERLPDQALETEAITELPNFENLFNFGKPMFGSQ